MSVLPAFGTPAGEAARAALVALVAGLMLAATERVHRRWHPPVEVTRKIAHVGGGLLAMSFPWLFRWPLTVVAICLAMAGLIGFAGRRGMVKGVTGVERHSHGEIYHPIAIALLFLLARHQPIFYVVSLWTLVIADAAAALLGKSYGRHTYSVQDERKSLEGSVVFFFVAFLGIHVPLLLFTGIDRAASVVVSLQLALLVTSFEAISMRGADNLVVPLATYYLLIKLTPQPATSIALQLAAQVALLVLALLLARATRFLTFAGAVAAHLTLYGAFGLGGPGWAVAPALALAGFILLEKSLPGRPAPEGRHQVRAVFYVSIVAMVLLGADNSFATLVGFRHPLGSGHPFLVPFVAALASQLAIGLLRVHRGWRHAKGARADAADHEHAPWLAWLTGGRGSGAKKGAPAPRGLTFHLISSIVLGFTVVVPVGLLAARGGSPGAWGTAALICLAAVVLYAFVLRRVRLPEGEAWELRRQTAAVAAAVLLWLPTMLAGRGAAP